MSVDSRSDPLIWFKGFEYIYFVRQLRVGWIKEEGQEKHLCANALDKQKWDGASHRLSAFAKTAVLWEHKTGAVAV